VLPSFVQTGIGNFFGNLGDLWTSVNQLLQGNVANGMSDLTPSIAPSVWVVCSMSAPRRACPSTRPISARPWACGA
jgi:hypothetical protein